MLIGYLTFLVWDPIEVRYELNWYQSVVKQIQYQKELANSELEQEIDKLNNRIIAEKYCGDSIMDTYYSLVEVCKIRNAF